MSKYNVTVIGSGPGGYTAAIRASQLGFNVAIVERENLGGICLNWGCIPSKSLLTSAHLLEEMKRASEFGLKAQGVEPDFPAVIQRSRGVANDMEKGVQYLMKKNNITVVTGEAKFKDRTNLEITHNGETTELESEKFIIAVGARARSLPGIEMDGEHVFGYRKAMTLPEKPASLCVVGAGAIGVEFSDFYASMGTKVTLLEYLPAVLPNEDEEVSKLLQKSFEKRGLDIHLGVKVQSAKPQGGNSVLVEWEDAQGDTQSAQFDKVLMATGVAANTEGLGLKNLGVRLEKDRVVVNDRYRTDVDNIYAIGDCIPGPALAHVASAEGIRAAEAIKLSSGRKAAAEAHLQYEPLNYNMVPACTYCHPEVASVGLTEKAALKQGLDIKVGRFPFTASGRAKAQGDSAGFVKVVSDAAYGQILGAHIIGPGATEMIAEFTLGAAMELVVDNFARTMHAHPTLSEGVMEATAAILGEAINI